MTARQSKKKGTKKYGITLLIPTNMDGKKDRDFHEKRHSSSTVDDGEVELWFSRCPHFSNKFSKCFRPRRSK